MFRAYFASRKWALWAYGVGAILILSILGQVYMTVLINSWRKDFGDLWGDLSHHTVNDFWHLIWVFFKIAMVYMTLATATNYISRQYALAWRTAITFDYLPRWVRTIGSIEGASQRIQEDANRFARIVESLGIQFVRSLMTLVAFVPVLWYISKDVRIEIDWLRFLNDMPGSLVWVSLIVTLGGLIVSWFVGIKLPGLEYNNQRVEAAFRKELVYWEDDLARRTAMDVATGLFSEIKWNYRRLYLHYGYFDMWANLYDQGLVVVPYMIAAPSVFLGLMTYGTLLQVAGAFEEVRSSMGFLIYNWTTVTELRSIRKRLREFEKNLDSHAI